MGFKVRPEPKLCRACWHVLASIQPSVHAGSVYERLVGATLHDCTVFENENLIRVSYGVEAVRDYECSSLSHPLR